MHFLYVEGLLYQEYELGEVGSSLRQHLQDTEIKVKIKLTMA